MAWLRVRSWRDGMKLWGGGGVCCEVVFLVLGPAACEEGGSVCHEGEFVVEGGV